MENELRERISNFNTEREDLQNDVEAFCSDVSVDLDTRWKLFVESGLGKIDDYIMSIEQFGFEYEDVLYEVRKYQHIDLTDMVDRISDWIERYGSMSEEQLPDSQKNKFGKFSNEVLVSFKEFILDNFTKECVMDW